MSKMTTLFSATIVSAMTLVSAGCSGSSVYVREDQATKVMSYSDTDLKLLAETMVGSLLSRDDILNARPKIWVSSVENKTSEYIDTQGILDKISVALLKSGRLRLVDREALKKLAQEKMLVDFQRIDTEEAVKVAKVLGADYVLSGNLMSVEHKDRGVFTDDKLVYYKFTLRLTSMNTEIVWMEEKEIKKASDKSKFF